MSELILEVLDERRQMPNVFAVSSLCEDGMHVIFWDFDISPCEKSLFKVENALSFIQQQYKLSQIYILETRNGYNAICLDKFDAKKIYEIKDKTAFDDRKHNEFGLRSNNWKFRAGREKKHVGLVNCNFMCYNKSNTHRVMLGRWYNINIIKDFAFDGSNNIKLDAYWCWKEECEKSVLKRKDDRHEKDK